MISDPTLVAIAAVLALVMLIRAFRGSHRATERPFFCIDPYVIDGDTLALPQTRIRLVGIDAPEMDQPGGNEARDHLVQLIEHDSGIITPLKTDHYGRMIAEIENYNGDLSSLMVRDGYAVSAYGRRYRAEERMARRERRGLWGKGGISCPAAHRRSRRV